MKRWLLAGLATTALVVASGGFASSPTPYGTWKDHLTLDEMYDGGFDPRLACTYKLVLAKDGTYKTYNDFDKWDYGTFTVSGSRIVFAEDKGCIEGGITTKKGFYRFSLKAGELKLKATKGDPCGGRWQTLTYPTWKRS